MTTLALQPACVLLPPPELSYAKHDDMIPPSFVDTHP